MFRIIGGIYEIVFALFLAFIWFFNGLPNAICAKDYFIPVLAVLTTPMIIIIFVLLIKDGYKNLTTKTNKTKDEK